MAHPYSNDASKLEREGAHSDPAVDEDRTRNNNLAQTMTMSPSLFEKMYLGPKTEVKGDLRKMFANPSPLALLVSLGAPTGTDWPEYADSSL